MLISPGAFPPAAGNLHSVEFLQKIPEIPPRSPGHWELREGVTSAGTFVLQQLFHKHTHTHTHTHTQRYTYIHKHTYIHQNVNLSGPRVSGDAE